MGVAYCTREDIIASLEIAHTARVGTLIDQRIQSASRSIESQMRRRFYPEVKTVTKDWPNYQYALPWRLYLDQDDVISVTTLSAGGTSIASSDYFLRPDDGPPYTKIEIDLESTAAFQSGNTHQRSISIAGTFGYNNDTTLAGELNAGINSSVTTAVIKPLNNVLGVGIGSVIKVNSERMLVTNRTMSDTTQNLQSALTANKTNNVVVVTTGSAFGINEIILIDAERMRVVDIAGNNLIVERAYDGTPLATHLSGVDIYALRTFTITRGALGTTADAHLADDDVYTQDPPALIRELAIAEAVVMLEQNAAAYARIVGAGENQRESSGRGLADIRSEALRAHARKGRIGAI